MIMLSIEVLSFKIKIRDEPEFENNNKFFLRYEEEIKNCNVAYFVKQT